MGSRVYIGRLSYKAREKDVERFFKGYGKVLDITMKNGYGFIEFDDFRDAEDAVYELNGKSLCGERVALENARGSPHGRDRQRLDDVMDRYGYRKRDRSRSRDRGRGRRRNMPTRTRHRIIVENLSTRVSWQDLKEYMRQVGDVAYADAHKHKRNEGIVEFMESACVKKAIEKLDGTDINGRNIKIIDDRPRRRSRSASRSVSRSQSRSRSRSRRSVSRSRSRSYSRSKSRERSRDGEKDGNRSREKSRSRSESRGREDVGETENGGERKESASDKQETKESGGDEQEERRESGGDKQEERRESGGDEQEERRESGGDEQEERNENEEDGGDVTV